MIIERTNTILYCTHWQETVDFYRDVFCLVVSHETDWFIEFQVASGSYLSVADTRKATIDSNDGRGITLAWKVQDIRAVHAELKRKGIQVTSVKQKWSAEVFYLHDPEGHRIELWQPAD